MEDQDLKNIKKTVAEIMEGHYLNSPIITCDSTNNNPEIVARNELCIRIGPNETLKKLITYITEEFDTETSTKPSLLLLADSNIDK